MALHEDNEYGPENCPECGGGNITGGHIEIELAVIVQDVWCECGERWQDVFEYVGVRRDAK